jgi:uncharacterized protein
MSHGIYQQIANELNVRQAQIESAVTLLDSGNTVPFVARYRKEVTGGLDDTQLRHLEARLGYLRELNDRRQTILKSIDDQEKLTPSLKQAILDADNKSRLEDLYLPYKLKRRTKGQIATEAGLAPLADALWQATEGDPSALAEQYLNSEHNILEVKNALDGARAIVMERLAEDAELIHKIRQHLISNADVIATVIAGKEQEGAKFSDYFDYREAWSKVPSHRALAILRGRNEGILQIALSADPKLEEGEKPTGSYAEVIMTNHCRFQLEKTALDAWRKQVIAWTWKIKISLHLETELMGQLRERAEEGAINVFADNLHDLLMAAPAGAKVTLALDPGLRTGSKIAVIDNTGKVLETATIYPHAPHNKVHEANAVLLRLIKENNVTLIAIGNGTASRETDQLVKDLIRDHQLKAQSVVVSEAGASVYSASELAANEFPNLDVSLRGAVSIGRRLQDPLAELVKIEPKSIGVGQYQHDVSQSRLAQRLDAVVEDCVNAVGVDLNMASPALLTRVAGLNTTLAQNIVAYRDENGQFNSRAELKKVARLGPKAFEQCAGFLKITQGKNPLDSSAVHPESYAVVKTISTQTGKAISALIGNPELLRTLNAQDFVTDTVGLPTIQDIFSELDKPGRDPRPEFKTATFAEGINEIKDLREEMILEGVITNVTNFGAFVDIGVHQDGLVHISALSDKFVSDPREVVKAGDVVKVKVMSVDAPRKRIGLSMRLNDKLEIASPNKKPEPPQKPKMTTHQKHTPSESPSMNNAFADAFAKAKKR